MRKTVHTIKNKSAKKPVKKPAAKSAAKPAKKAIKNTAAKKLLPKALRLEQLDRLLLKLAPVPYEKLRGQIILGKNRINEERKLALTLGTRILNKAKDVRGQLMKAYRKSKK